MKRDHVINEKPNRKLRHTFVICAYKESPFLDECIESLKSQSLKSEIIMVTHTPNEYIKDAASRYNIPLIVNTGEGGITQDWNFGLAQVKTKYATIAHQDDTYEPDYLKYIYREIKRTKNPIIAFSDSFLIQNGVKTESSGLLKIKKMLLFPLRSKTLAGTKFMRRRSLSLGNSICCPAVTYVMDRIQQPLFENHFTSNEDWEAWEKLSRLDGGFAYVTKPLMSHRIHEDSTTAAMIEDNKRAGEDLEMFRKFWPAPIAKLIGKFYSTSSEKYNEV